MASSQKVSGYGYTELQNDLAMFQGLYPFLHVESIGTSAMGRELFAVRLGQGPKEIHFNGAFHANEWITTPLLMKFIEDYAKAYCADGSIGGRSCRELFEQTSLWIVPMVNPDGVELVLKGAAQEHPLYRELLEWNGGSADFTQWKANIHGVDLNDQFPARWEEERQRRSVPGPAPRDYAGDAPLSEPEAAAMARFTRRHNFRLVIALHTQGEEIYWNYQDLEPEESAHIARRLEQVSGYKAVRLSGSDAGYKDWFIQDFRRPGFTVEAGLGVNPLPVSQFPDIYHNVSRLLLEALIV